MFLCCLLVLANHLGRAEAKFQLEQAWENYTKYYNTSSELFVLKVDGISSLGTEKAILFTVQMNKI